MKKGIIIVLVAIVLIIAFTMFKGVGAYNKIIASEEAVKAQGAQVENTYQRPYDLVPNLVATVQGEADFEKSTLSAVVDARSKMGGVVKIDADKLGDEATMKRFQESQATLGGALQRLMMVTENYPDLKSNQSFQDLRVQLEGAENRIAAERRRYNETVRDYNTYIRQFPANIIAGVAGASPKVPFESVSGASTAPTVKFNTK